MDYKFIEPISEDFYCSICRSVLCQPVLTECCGQHFCRACLDSWFDVGQGEICPHCRNKDFKYIKSLPMIRKINELNILCPLQSLGCTDVFRLDILNDHLRICDFLLVHCPNMCGEMLFRKDAQEHLVECSQRPIRSQRQGDIIDNEGSTDRRVTVQFSWSSDTSLHTPSFALTQAVRAHLLLELESHTTPRQLLTKKQDATISLILENKETELLGFELKIEQENIQISNSVTPLRSIQVLCDKCNPADAGNHGDGVYVERIFGHPCLKEILKDGCQATVTIATHNCTDT